MRKPEVVSVVWHSVEPGAINPDFLVGFNPTLSQFREQIRFLVDTYTPITIQEFLELMETPSLPRFHKKPPVLLTFDDGFKNVIDQALPVLTEFGVPALFFVIGETIKNPAFVPWFVESTHVIRKTSKRIVAYENQSLDLTSQAGRRRLNELFGVSFHAARSERDRNTLLNNLAALLGIERPAARDLDDDLRFVGPNDLAELGSSSLLTVASHAMTHRYLDGLTYEQQRYELQQSHILLSGCSPSYFPALAYPGGLFNADTVALGKETYRCAFATGLGSYRNTYAYFRVIIGQDTTRHVAYAISPQRLRYVIPLRRFMHNVRTWRSVQWDAARNALKRNR